MWWSNSKKSGCDVSSGETVSPSKEVNSAKMRISAMLVLDRYCEWIRQHTTPRVVAKEGKLITALNASGIHARHPVFNVGPGYVCELCKLENWNAFKKDSGLTLRVDLTKVLGIRNKERQALVRLYATLAVNKLKTRSNENEQS